MKIQEKVEDIPALEDLEIEMVKLMKDLSCNKFSQLSTYKVNQSTTDCKVRFCVKSVRAILIFTDLESYTNRGSNMNIDFSGQKAQLTDCKFPIHRFINWRTFTLVTTIL